MRGLQSVTLVFTFNLIFPGSTFASPIYALTPIYIDACISQAHLNGTCGTSESSQLLKQQHAVIS